MPGRIRDILSLPSILPLFFLVVLALLGTRAQAEGQSVAIESIEVHDAHALAFHPRSAFPDPSLRTRGLDQGEHIILEDFEARQFPPPGWEVYDETSVGQGDEARHTWSRQECHTHPEGNGSAVAWSGGGGTAGQHLRCGQNLGESVNSRLAILDLDTRNFPGGLEVRFHLWLDVPLGNGSFNLCWRDSSDSTAYCSAYVLDNSQLRKRWLVLDSPFVIEDLGGKPSVELMFWFMDVAGSGDYEGAYIDNVEVRGRSDAVTPPRGTPTATRGPVPPTPHTRDGMRMQYVPAGPFTRGSLASDPRATPDELPQHEVTLDAFWIDETEITNAMFEHFVAQTGYATIADQAGFTYGFDAGGNYVPIDDANWRQPFGPSSNIEGKEDHPVVAIGWRDAQAYCAWAGRRLPTEAEWEKAARGTDARIYPWGDEPVTGRRANVADQRNPLPWHDASIDDGFRNTSPVDQYPDGASPYQVLGMAGNAAEWVLDNYDASLYPRTRGAINPLFRDYGNDHVLRGGNYNDDPDHVRSARRFADDTLHSAIDMGIRCATNDRVKLAYLPVALKQRPAITPTSTPTATRGVTPTPPPDPCRPIPELEAQRGHLNIVGPPANRPADQHPEYNLALRGYVQADEDLRLVHYDGHTDLGAPQLYDIFDRVPRFTSAWRVNQWLYGARPERAGPPETAYPVSLLGFETHPEELIRVPDANYDIGRGYRVQVLHASEQRITLKYTGEDSVVSGYTLHIENICVEPGLLASYREFDRAGRGSLPAVMAKAPIGRPHGHEILVSIRDTGRWMDPRSKKDWWHRASFEWLSLEALDRSWIRHDTGLQR